MSHYAEYGIGYKVTASDDIAEDDLNDGLFEYLDRVIGGDWEHFSTGIDGECTYNYVVVKDAFKDGLNLTDKKKTLDDELKRLKLDAVGKFGDVGGLFYC